MAGISTTLPLPSLAAIVLAGGQGKRMGYQEKGLIQLKQRALLDYVLDKLRPYSEQIVISANRALEQYQQFNFPIVQDLPTYSQRGPLAGIYSAAASLSTEVEFIQVLPCDTPYLPHDLVLQFYQYLQANPDKELVMAVTSNKEHPVIMQCRPSVIAKLKVYLDDPQILNRVMSFIKRCDYGTIEFDDTELFINMNDPSLLQG